MKKFEEEFWDRPPVRRVPDLEPDFDKFKREYLDKMEPITEEERRSIAERNRQLLVKRARQKRRILSMAACAAVAVGVVGTAIWLGHDGAVVPHPESGAEETDSAVSTTETTETDGTTETTDRHMEDIDVWTYEDVIQLTGLPLVKADDIEGFRKYRINTVNKITEEIVYIFENANVYIHIKAAGIHASSVSNITEYNGYKFYVTQLQVSENRKLITVDYFAEDGLFYTIESDALTADECIALLNSLIM